MGKAKSDKDDFRVVVRPRRMGDYVAFSISESSYRGFDAESIKRWERNMQSRCEEILADIKQHVEGVGSVHVEYDQSDICEHCKEPWTSNKDECNGCCDKEVEEWEQRSNAHNETCEEVDGE